MIHQTSLPRIGRCPITPADLITRSFIVHISNHLICNNNCSRNRASCSFDVQSGSDSKGASTPSSQWQGRVIGKFILLNVLYIAQSFSRFRDEWCCLSSQKQCEIYRVNMRCNGQSWNVVPTASPVSSSQTQWCCHLSRVPSGENATELTG